MKLLMALFCLMLGTVAIAQGPTRKNYDDLTKDDQKYFQNGIMEGKNHLERVNANVKAINDLYGKIEAMEKEIAQLKNEVAQLKAKPAK